MTIINHNSNTTHREKVVREHQQKEIKTKIYFAFKKCDLNIENNEAIELRFQQIDNNTSKVQKFSY